MTAPRWIADPLLQVDRLTMRFGGLVAVNNVSFAAGRGDITALIGPNGAGKTTLFNCLTGFYKPTVGRIAFSPRGGLDIEPDRRPDRHQRQKLPRRRRGHLPAGAHGRPRDRQKGAGRAHVSKHPPVPRHERARKPHRRPACRLGQSLWSFGVRPARPALVAPRRARRGGAGRKMAGADRIAPPRQRSGRRPALWRSKAARNRPRHVFRPGLALPRRTGGGAQRQ